MDSSSIHLTDKSKYGKKLTVINMRIWYTHRWCPLQLSALNKSISLVCQNIVNTLLETVSQSKILNNKFWYEIASYIGTSAPLHCLRLIIRLVAGFEWVLNKRVWDLTAEIPFYPPFLYNFMLPCFTRVCFLSAAPDMGAAGKGLFKNILSKKTKGQLFFSR